MRDGNQTGYAPKPTPGVTPDQRIEVTSRSVPCDGEVGVGGLGHPRVWLPMCDRRGPGRPAPTVPSPTC